LRNFKTSYDYIIWLDSDVIIKKEFDPSAFLPNDDQLYSSIFKTDNLPDSGFIAFNTKHADYDKFLKDYLNYYFSKKIMTLGNPYDNYILSDYMTHTSVRNLWKGIVTDKSDATCGFVDTVLEDILDHHWGKKGKKEIGL
jgi:alpha-N-acetylglucosamine transferase